MKNTFKFGPSRSISIEQDRHTVVVNFMTDNQTALTHVLSRVTALVVGMTVATAALTAEKDPAHYGQRASINLGMGKSLDVWPEGGRVVFAVRLFGIDAIREEVAPDVAALIADAMTREAEAARGVIA